jgi:hypothetical protein
MKKRKMVQLMVLVTIVDNSTPEDILEQVTEALTEAEIMAYVEIDAP